MSVNHFEALRVRKMRDDFFGFVYQLMVGRERTCFEESISQRRGSLEEKVDNFEKFFTW
jgi:hypothetical protein